MNTGTLGFAARRVLLFFPTALIVLFSVFALGRLTGDPITVALGDRLTSEELARRVAAAGYDQPIVVQFTQYLGAILRGDFGVSAQSGLPVLEQIAPFVPASLELGLSSLVMALIIALPVTWLAARRPGGVIDSAIRSTAVIVYALPVFLTALLLRLVFSVWLPVFPNTGRLSLDQSVQVRLNPGPTGMYLLDSLLAGNANMFLDALSHLFLPSLAIAAIIAANLIRVIRSNLVYASRSEPLEFAKSLGLSQSRLLFGHQAKLIAPQVLTSFGYSVVGIIGGFVYAEVSFEWRGLGSIMTRALLQRDFEVLQAVVVLLVLLIISVNLLIDLTIRFIDRRYRIDKIRGDWN